MSIPKWLLRKVRSSSSNKELVDKANRMFDEANSLFTQKQSHSMEDYRLLVKLSTLYTRAIELDPSQHRFFNNRGFMNYQVTLVLLQHVSQEGRIGFFCKTNERFKEIQSETGLLSEKVRSVLNECINNSLKDFTKTVELDPHNSAARTSLANVLIDLGQFDNALKELETAESLARHPEAKSRVASDLKRVKDIITQDDGYRCLFDKDRSDSIVSELRELQRAVLDLPAKHPFRGSLVGPGAGQARQQFDVLCDVIGDVVRALENGVDIHGRSISPTDTADGLKRFVAAARQPGWMGLVSGVFDVDGFELLRRYIDQLEAIANRIA